MTKRYYSSTVWNCKDMESCRYFLLGNLMLRSNGWTLGSGPGDTYLTSNAEQGCCEMQTQHPSRAKASYCSGKALGGLIFL